MAKCHSAEAVDVDSHVPMVPREVEMLNDMQVQVVVDKVDLSASLLAQVQVQVLAVSQRQRQVPQVVVSQRKRILPTWMQSLSTVIPVSDLDYVSGQVSQTKRRKRILVIDSDSDSVAQPAAQPRDQVLYSNSSTVSASQTIASTSSTQIPSTFRKYMLKSMCSIR